MTADFGWRGELELDTRFGYLSPDVAAPRRHNPRIVLNDGASSVLRILREELSQCDEFLFSVAFVSPRAIALLKQELVEFSGAGRIVTSDYLAFNSPTAFRELLNLDRLGIDVRVHPAKAFHPKGYIFKRSGMVTAMMGSSNLTEAALVTNHEWNLKVSAATASDLGTQLSDLVAHQLCESNALTSSWIDSYEASYVPPTRPPTQIAAAAPATETIEPNSMQEAALASIAGVRAAGHNRAIVISATGTGKTILSALDVRAVDPVRLLFLVHREQILDKAITEYRKVLGGPPEEYGKLTGSVKQPERRYLFANVHTLSQPGVLEQFAPDAFDYVVIDEAHRAAATTHRRVMDHFSPEFMLGMTATPERTDGFNVFALFDYNVPYEIRLSHALEEEMLTPFHYYGVADLTYDDGTTTSGDADLTLLISPDRVDHLINALETYGQAGVAPRGLIFCSRNVEARALATALNDRTLRGKPLRTVALSGDNSPEEREHHVRALERGELDYILTVDIFNEGVDIPTINQVVMLRQTQSAIVFVQQLGRGLRKADGKEYLVVIDFIGNYATNFLIPIALFGDESLNKESLRQNLIAAEESGVLPGLSSVRFDRVAQQRVLASITETKLDSLQNIKKSIDLLRNRLGHMPALTDFLRFESVDPVLLATKDRSYPALLERLFKPYDAHLSAEERRILRLLSNEVLPAKRLHESVLVELLLEHRRMPLCEIGPALRSRGVAATDLDVESAVNSLTLATDGHVAKERYGGGIANVVDGTVALLDAFIDAFRLNEDFADSVRDLLQTTNAMVRERYARDRPFTPGRQYSRIDATRILNTSRSDASIIYGYKVYRDLGTCPIFVTLHKGDDISASTAYKDEIIDRHTMRWYTRSNRTLRSAEVSAIVDGTVDLHVFVRKGDADGSDHYYLGEAIASDAEQVTMPNDEGKELPVVRMMLRFAEPIDSALFDYFHPEITA